MSNKTANILSRKNSSGTIAIEVNGLNKWFDKFHVLKDISMSVLEKEIIVICGPSGSGKSTFIRCLNHLETYQEGSVSIFGQELGNDKKSSALIRENVGMLFQSFNLFPHLTILKNYTRHHMVEKNTRNKSRRTIHGLAGQGWRFRFSIKIPRPNIGRATTTCRNCSLPGHGTQNYAV